MELEGGPVVIGSELFVGLSALATSMFAPPTEPERGAEIRVGLGFAETIPSHEQASLRERFEVALPKACEPPPCIEDCGEDQRSLGLLIAGDSRDYTLSWRAWGPRIHEPLITESSCELCSLVEVQDQLAAELAALCARLDALDAAPGRVRVSADPDRARVRVDGRDRGRAPWVGELSVGDHTLEVGARGYGSQQRTVLVVAGVEEHEYFELLASRRRPSWPGWMSVGLGVVMGVAGATLVALDDKDWQGRCSGADLDADGSCRFVYATGPLGVGLAIAGGVTITTGVGLLVWAERGSSTQASAGLGWKGRF